MTLSKSVVHFNHGWFDRAKCAHRSGGHTLMRSRVEKLTQWDSACSRWGVRARHYHMAIPIGFDGVCMHASKEGPSRSSTDLPADAHAGLCLELLHQGHLHLCVGVSSNTRCQSTYSNNGHIHVQSTDLWRGPPARAPRRGRRCTSRPKGSPPSSGSGWACACAPPKHGELVHVSVRDMGGDRDHGEVTQYKQTYPCEIHALYPCLRAPAARQSGPCSQSVLAHGSMSPHFSTRDTCLARSKYGKM